MGTITPMKWSAVGGTEASVPALANDTTGAGYWNRVPTTASCLTQSIDDVVIPRFSSRQANGECFFNPLTSVKLTEEVACKGFHDYRAYSVGYQGTKWYYHYRFKDAPALANIFFGTYSLPSIPTAANSVLDSCLTAAISQCSVNSASALETFAEFAESLETLKGVLKTAYRLLKAFRGFALVDFLAVDDALRAAFVGKDINRPIRLKDIRDRWLELRYGIRPLVYDIINWCRAFQANMAYTRFKGTSRAMLESTKTTSYTSRGSSGGGNFTVRTDTDSYYDVSAGCLAQLDLAEVNSLSYQLGGTRLLQTAWELIPYSFVVDWFYNVGKTIDSWIPQPGVTTLGTWRTVCYHREFVETTTGFTPFKETTSVSATMTITHKVSEMRIVRVGNPATPILPSLQLKMNVAKIADLLALFSQILE